MSTENQNVITSPVGSIQFMAIEKPVKQSKSSDKEVYTVKLAFDIKTCGGFLDQISSVNDAKVVTAQTYRGKDAATKALLATGKALVSANSKFKPMVSDTNGNILEEAPMFFAGSTGTAQMLVEPWTGDKGGTINLVGVVIHSIDSPESNTETNKEAKVASIKAKLKAAAEAYSK